MGEANTKTDLSAFDQLRRVMSPAIERQLQQVVRRGGGEGLDTLHAMLAYHMGWKGEGAGPEATGKRLRPLLLLLTTAAAGGQWERALPAAAAVELLHNFSLIHDDIEDNSPLRRGRPTVWVKWGVPQAINTGDAMFTLAHLAMLDLQETTSPATAMQAARMLLETCLHLTQGQYLDISYEARGDLTVEAYWPMVSGKTAALIRACTGIGALVGGAEDPLCEAYAQFGRLLGLAFQAQDDLLGIWGKAEQTGKSAESDLVSGKKSLPVLIGLGLDGPFAERWREGPVPASEAAQLAAQLDAEGARAETEAQANRLTEQALEALEQAQPQGEAGEALHALARRLLGRTV